MSETRDTYILLRAFVDELARCGVAGACTSPGSRSTPLVLSLARDGGIPVTSHVDERSAGFFALGLVKVTGRPAVLACTSGTAAANYAPAVHEAWEARLPLIVLTADRPPELREVGAGQVIDQVKLYGSAAKWFFEVGNHAATPDRVRWMRQLACRAVWTALDGRPGPVHLNFPLREPLVLDGPLPDDEPGGGGRPDGKPWTDRIAVAEDPAPLVAWLREHRHGVIVAGRDEAGGGAVAGEAIARLAEALGWPLLADPLSGARRGGAAIAHYDALLRDPEWAEAVSRGVGTVLRIGDLPTSKPLRQWLRDLEAPQAALLPSSAWADPDAVVRTIFDLRPDALTAIDETWHVDAAWLGAWRAADATASRALTDTLGAELTEPAVARALATAVPAGAHVLVAASMPIRDVETFWPVDATAGMALSNRGANGIDGTISTAYGIAAATGAPTYLHIGDVAVAHDIGGLLAGKRLGIPLTIVVVDNAGGGIFEFLPVATQRDAFEEHVLTPTGLDVERVAALYDAEYRAIGDVDDLRDALADPPSEGTRILHVRTARDANVALHRRCWDAVATALRPA